MRRTAIIVAVLSLASLCFPPLPRLLAQGATVEQVITQRVRAYFAAMGSGDLAVIERSLAEDYLVIGGDGKTVNEGMDFGVVGNDGKLQKIVGFFGPIKPL